MTTQSVDRSPRPVAGRKERGWSSLYENVCGSRRLLEGNIKVHQTFVLEIAQEVTGGGRVLEVGSGTGVLCAALAEAGVEVISLDNDPGILWMAGINAATLGCDIKYMEGDAFELPFPDNYFNVAYSHGLLEHFEDEQIHVILSEQLRVARVVTSGMPVKGNKMGSYGNERWLTPDEWLTIFKGYRVLRAYTYANDDMLIVSILKDGSNVPTD